MHLFVTMLTVVLAVGAASPAVAVVGGTLAAPGSHPHLVSIEDDGEHICGGDLVDRDTVLTSAHCVVVDEQGREPLPPDRFRVLAGTTRRSAGGERLAVEAVVVHPGFGRPHARSHDVALLHLDRAPKQARAIRLVSPQEQQTTWAAGRPAIVAGWGTTSVLGTAPEDDLRQAGVPLRSTETCSARYPVAVPTSAAFDPATNLCAGEDAGGVDACSFDSGSSLTVAAADGERLLVGLPSFGLGCATPGFPGVYAAVGEPALHGWIVPQLGPGRPR